MLRLRLLSFSVIKITMQLNGVLVRPETPPMTIWVEVVPVMTIWVEVLPVMETISLSSLTFMLIPPT